MDYILRLLYRLIKKKVKMFDLYLIKTDDIKINEKEKVSTLKEEYIKLNDLDKKKVCLRLFFGGTELIDENELYKYGIKDGYTVQVSKRALD